VRHDALLRRLPESPRECSRAEERAPGDRLGEPGERWLYCYPDEAFAEY
jgi:hypothetical protein